MPRDLILAFETSNPSAWTKQCAVRPGVAVGRLEGGAVRVLGAAEIDPLRPHDDTLLSAAQSAVRSCGGTPRDLSCVAVSAGPGGYTAVRLAITAAKMIAEATGAACIAVPSAMVVARRVVPAPGAFAVLLASKGVTAFATVFDAVGTPRGKGKLVEAGAIAGLGVERIIADQFLPESIRAAAEAASVAIQIPLFDPAACLEASIGLEAVDPIALAPIYPREPEAVTKWRALRTPEPGSGPDR